MDRKMCLIWNAGGSGHCRDMKQRVHTEGGGLFDDQRNDGTVGA